jgi:hypothetical protein
MNFTAIKQEPTVISFGSTTTEAMAIDEKRGFLFMGQGVLGLKVNVESLKILDIFFADTDLVSLALDIEK